MIEHRSFSVGRVFRRALGVMTHNPLIVFGAAGLIYAGPLTLYNYGALQGRDALIRDYPTAGLFIPVLASLPFALFLRGLVQGFVVRASVAESEGRRAGLRECLGRPMRRLISLAAASGLFSLGATLGLSLLLVPGFVFATVYTIVAPVVVEERLNAIGAFRRASRLTRGARWQIFGVGLLVLLLAWAWQLAGRLAAIALLGSHRLNEIIVPALLWEAAFATLGIGFSAAVQTALYVELRNDKDGAPSDLLSEIFR